MPFRAGCFLESRRLGGLLCGLGNTRQKEFHPRFPTACLTDFLEKTVVVAAPRLEEETEIEDRLAQHARAAQHQRDEQPAETTIAVQEGMNGFELRATPKPSVREEFYGRQD